MILVALATCVLNREYVMVQCIYGTSYPVLPIVSLQQKYLKIKKFHRLPAYEASVLTIIPTLQLRVKGVKVCGRQMHIQSNARWQFALNFANLEKKFEYSVNKCTLFFINISESMVYCSVVARLTC